MNVSSYVFQSPYPQSVQVGRPDPTAKTETEQQDGATQTGSVTNPSEHEAQQYLQRITSNTAASINVADSSTRSNITAAVDGFTTLNTQTQALEAYSGQ